jgi:hypothetical protein
MRKIYLLSLFLISLSMFPQGAPKAINYQGVARNVNGDPIVGAIAVKVEIHAGANNGPVVCSEIFHVTTNQFGIFDLRIGSMSPLQFNAISWGATKHFAGVALDPTGGNTFGTDISNQELVSVPYALYAENSGNAGPSTTITSTFPSILSVVSAPPSHTINYTPPQLQLTNDTILNIIQGAYTSSAVIFKPAGASATSTPLSPWSQLNPNVFLVNSGNNVGIGTNSPSGKLTVLANAAGNSAAIEAVGTNAYGMYVSTNANSNAYSAIYALNNGGANSGPGITGVATSSLGGVNAIVGQNTGSGTGVYGYNTVGSPSATANGVVGETNSPNNSAVGVSGINNGAGAGVSGYANSNNGGPGVWAISNSTVENGLHGVSNGGNAGVYGEVYNNSSSGNAYGVVGKTNSNNQNVAGVWGQNVSNGHGVLATTTSSSVSSYAVLGRNTGQGEGVYGETGQVSSGINAAVHGNQLGIGPGLRGTIPSGTAAGSPNVALLIENGHIQAVSANAPTFVVANNTGTTVGTGSLVAGSNDVRGMFLVNVTPGSNWNPGGSFDFTLTFNKAYVSGGPWLTIAKYDSSNYIYEVSSVTTTSVTFKIRNGSPGQQAPGAGITQLRLMYMVMQ